MMVESGQCHQQHYYCDKGHLQVRFSCVLRNPALPLAGLQPRLLRSMRSFAAVANFYENSPSRPNPSNLLNQRPFI